MLFILFLFIVFLTTNPISFPTSTQIILYCTTVLFCLSYDRVCSSCRTLIQPHLHKPIFCSWIPSFLSLLPATFLFLIYHMVMSESRVELLAWVNALLCTQYSKIEQLGTGAAYCQIFDSVWGDVQTHKVKFDARLEYEYIANFKILQIAFDAHTISKTIPVERLIKCRLQDNLEFLQWVKRFHDKNYPGGVYDANARRSIKSTSKSIKSSSPLSISSSGPPPLVHKSLMGPRSIITNTRTSSSPSKMKTGLRPSSANGHSSTTTTTTINTTSTSFPSSVVEQMQSQLEDMHGQVDELNQVIQEQTDVLVTLERERNFYYSKLRDIEILIQQEAARGYSSDLMTMIQEFLYATEEGFEVANDNNTILNSEAGITSIQSDPSVYHRNDLESPNLVNHQFDDDMETF